MDDFLCIDESEEECNRLVSIFLDLCSKIGCPISIEKTEFATTKVVFLGILLDGERFVLVIPEDKSKESIGIFEESDCKKKDHNQRNTTTDGHFKFPESCNDSG